MLQYSMFSRADETLGFEFDSGGAGAKLKTKRNSLPDNQYRQ